MANPDPDLITSGFSREVTRQGVNLRLQIYRLEEEPGWTLEVVNAKGTSTVWDDFFETDDAANKAFRSALDEEGVEAFLDSGMIIPFRSKKSDKPDM